MLWVIGFHNNLPLGRDGLFGVDMFFALSGFLITVLLVEEWQRNGIIRLKNFYIRRIMRLYPALVLLLIVIIALAPRPYIVSTLFYFTNWMKAFHLQPDSLYLDHAWSLSVEEQYYLFWPVILYTLLRIKIPKKIIVIITLTLGLTSALARVLVWNSTHDWFRVYMGTDLHADGLLLGSAFGLMTAFRFLPKYIKIKRILALITLITFLLAAWLLIEKQLTQEFIPLYGNLGVSIGTIIIISRLVNYPSPLIEKIFSFGPLVKIGVISYGLYLWHAPIAVLIDQVGLSWSPEIAAVAKIAISFLAAGLSYWLVEKPILRLKQRFTVLQPAD